MDETDAAQARSNNTSNPILSMDIDAEKLKGDAIGSTLYSESGLLKTLIALSKFTAEDWSEQLEEQLCFLWDMTFEEDVMAVLMEHDFINLACHAIRITSEPRLVEILVGILGNMTGRQDVRLSLSQSSTAELLLSLLSSSDTLTLLQLVRLFNSCVWHVNKGSRSSDFDEDEHSGADTEVESWVSLLIDEAPALNERLSFILRSSTNEELLQSALELLNNLCCISSKNHYYSEFLSTPVLLIGLTEALHQLLNSGDGDTLNMVWEEKMERAAVHWSQTMSTFTLHDRGIDLINEQRQTVMRSFCCIFDPLGLPENIFPLNSKKLEILDSILDVLECFKRKHNYCPPAILPRLLTVLSLMSPMSDKNGGELSGMEELESEDDLEKHAEILTRVFDYCFSVLCDTETPDFLEAFGDDPIPKVNTLLSNLSKCLGTDIQKVIKIIQRHLN